MADEQDKTEPAMTIHISFVCNMFVLVVGDRLLTVAGASGRNTWDPAANKTIYVEAVNGRLVVSYAGLAYIRDGRPSQTTDEWLLRTIAQVEPPPPMRAGLGHPSYFGPMPKVTVGDVLNRIRDTVNSTFPLLSAADQANGLEVMVAGWSWPRDVNAGNARPSTVSKQLVYARLKDADWTTTPRRRYRQPSTGWDLTSIGAGSNALLASITDRLRSRSSTNDDVEAVVVDAIRSAATPGSGIGRDLTSIYIPIYGGDPRVRYFREQLDAVSFSPAFALRGGIMYPQVLRGNLPELEYAENSWIKIEAIPPFPDGGHTYSMSSQPRPPLR